MERIKKLAIFFWRLFLAVAILAATAPVAPAANDVHISGASYYVTVAQNVPWNQLSANYIFTPQSPNVGLCVFVENSNPTNAHGITITAFQSGNPSLTKFATNPNLWAASQIVNNFTTVAANSASSVFINTIGAANVALVISGTATLSGTPDTANVFVVQSTVPQCGSASTSQTVQGAQPTNSTATSLNPVYIGGLQNSGISLQPFQVGPNGSFIATRPNSTFNGTGTATAVGTPDLVTGTVYGAAQFIYDDKIAASVLYRSISQFASGVASAAGNTAVWTPVAGNKFRLMCISVEVTGNATMSAAGEEVITLQDGTTGIPGFTWNVFVPSTALNTRGQLYTSGTVCFPNGLVSSTANNVLNVNLGTALTAGHVVVRAWGGLN